MQRATINRIDYLHITLGTGIVFPLALTMLGECPKKRVDCSTGILSYLFETFHFSEKKNAEKHVPSTTVQILDVITSFMKDRREKD
jgi:hypothetical protein